MNFLLPDRKRKFEKLTGTNPSKLYVPVNAGRTVGNPKQKAYGGFNAAKNSEAVELSSWIAQRVNDGTIAITKFNKTVNSVSADTTVTTPTNDVVYLVDAAAGAVAITLPDPSTTNFSVTVKKVDAEANDVTVNPSDSETIDGAATDTISSQHASVTYVTDGTNWFTV